VGTSEARERRQSARILADELGRVRGWLRSSTPFSLEQLRRRSSKIRSGEDTAFAGDVVGIPNHGTLRIGDTLTEGEELTFIGVPSFAPEILRRVRLMDAMKAKKLKQALQEMAEEGVVQVFRPLDGFMIFVAPRRNHLHHLDELVFSNLRRKFRFVFQRHAKRCRGRGAGSWPPPRPHRERFAQSKDL